ncbi:MAG: hypothetical protein ACOYI3_00245 [Christensenellales bacterium]|jgi:hypothetical protein
MRKERLLWFTAAVLMLALFSVTAYAAEGEAGTITVKPITNDPYPIAMGLPEKISNLFTFPNDPEGYTLSDVRVDENDATMFQIDDFGTQDFYLICKSSSADPNPLSLTFVFTSAEHPAEPKEAEGTISIELTGNPFYGANEPGQTQTIPFTSRCVQHWPFSKKRFRSTERECIFVFSKSIDGYLVCA